MKMISNQVSTMCIFLAVNCCMIAWTPSEPSVMPSSFIKMNDNEDQIPPERMEEDQISKEMEEMFNTLNNLMEEGGKKIDEKFRSEMKEEEKKQDIPEEEEKKQDIPEEVQQNPDINVPKDQPMPRYVYDKPIDIDAIAEALMKEPKKQEKDVRQRETPQPLFFSGKELTAGARELIRETREIYAGKGKIQETYKQYNSKLAEELRMNHHFSNFTKEKSNGEKRKQAELSLRDFD